LVCNLVCNLVCKNRSIIGYGAMLLCADDTSVLQYRVKPG
jgi:hypothetical protein